MVSFLYVLFSAFNSLNLLLHCSHGFSFASFVWIQSFYVCSLAFHVKGNTDTKTKTNPLRLVPLNFTKILITWNHEMPRAWFHVKITWFHVIFIPWSREIPKIRPFHVKSRDHEITWRGTTSDMDHSPIAIFFEILPSYPSHLEFQIWQHHVEGHFAWWVA